jgi:hypothetical protein
MSWREKINEVHHLHPWQTVQEKVGRLSDTNSTSSTVTAARFPTCSSPYQKPIAVESAPHESAMNPVVRSETLDSIFFRSNHSFSDENSKIETNPVTLYISYTVIPHACLDYSCFEDEWTRPKAPQSIKTTIAATTTSPRKASGARASGTDLPRMKILLDITVARSKLACKTWTEVRTWKISRQRKISS